MTYSDPPDISTWGILRAYYRKHPGLLLAVAVLTLVYPVSSIAFAIVFGKLAAAISAKNEFLMKLNLGILLGIFGAVFASYAVDIYVSQMFAVSLTNLIVGQLTYYILETRKTGASDSVPAHELMVYIISFLEQMHVCIIIFRNTIIPDLLTIALAGIYLLVKVDRVLGLLALAAAVGVCLGVASGVLIKSPTVQASMEADANIEAQIGDLLDKFALVIDTPGAPESEISNIHRLGEISQKARKDSIIWSARLTSIVILTAVFFTAAFFYRIYTTFLASGKVSTLNKNSLELAVTLVSLLIQIAKSVRSVAYNMYELIRSTAGLNQARDVIDEFPPATGRDYNHLALGDAAIVFEDVHFAYKGSSVPVFRKTSLVVKEGERVAVVGPNGCGKSTFTRLLMKHEHPLSGKIAVKGGREAIAYGGQKVQLFRGRSVFQNIVYSRIGANVATPQDRADVEDHLNSLGLTNFITELGGLDYVVEGSNMSGGQCQVLQIVRLLFQRKVRTLVLDEITSALDVYHTGIIKDILANMPPGVTVIFITHDPSLITNMATSVISFSAEMDPIKTACC